LVSFDLKAGNPIQLYSPFVFLLIQLTSCAACFFFFFFADFRPSWNWNTKQVFAYVYFEYTTKKNVVNQVVVWDRIIKNVEDANIDEQAIRAEYLLADQGYHLKNADVKLHVGWDITPITGFLHGGRSTGAHVTLPDEYLPQ
jgi:signal peptidase complex subunit 3